jgi:hypothetical protein
VALLALALLFTDGLLFIDGLGERNASGLRSLFVDGLRDALGLREAPSLPVPGAGDGLRGAPPLASWPVPTTAHAAPGPAPIAVASIPRQEKRGVVPGAK